MEIKVRKLTDIALLHIANSFTTGKDSSQSLRTAYRMGHSTIRTQIFLVTLYGIPQYVAYHLRTHFSLTPMAPEEYGWMKSKRTDRGGEDFRDKCINMRGELYVSFNSFCADSEIGTAESELEERKEDIFRQIDEIKALPDRYDRYAPTDFAFTVSAEGLMNMAQKRLCTGSVSKETREVMEGICEEVKKVDPWLYPHLVKPCVATGVCREKCCGFIKSELFRKLRNQYKSLFTT